MVVPNCDYDLNLAVLRMDTLKGESIPTKFTLEWATIEAHVKSGFQGLRDVDFFMAPSTHILFAFWFLYNRKLGDPILLLAYGNPHKTLLAK
jgi:hypothetical protein